MSVPNSLQLYDVVLPVDGQIVARGQVEQSGFFALQV